MDTGLAGLEVLPADGAEDDQQIRTDERRKKEEISEVIL